MKARQYPSMKQVHMFMYFLICSTLIITLTSCSPVHSRISSRMKRQSADVRTAEYLAWIALGGKVPSRGCEIVACGVVDVYSSGKKKRDNQLSDEERLSLLRALITRAAQENTSS
ncbi:uncharacterized protein LOC106057786 isoform X2 [Biomphalaria glabrata]|uniref:Uncharacterized protein LOC106057786 isoform X2 n=2 Tax=Biomphalaria glabrata TaxID=6526 RepID=A0A9W3BMW4_BIOGL|nr:uncharacterized protein LOC106057786 isoform X2 [Biomphalaria glabrata]XP_055900930.1 uncharacterized protein LOC106057786 isoform X2 [Biomphalaria glabrata]